MKPFLWVELTSRLTSLGLFGANFGKMLFQIITGKDQGRVMDEIGADFEPKHGVSFGHRYITKASTLLRVEGNTHFLERNS